VSQGRVAVLTRSRHFFTSTPRERALSRDFLLSLKAIGSARVNAGVTAAETHISCGFKSATPEASRHFAAICLIASDCFYRTFSFI
jgi:hypothetical protein